MVSSAFCSNPEGFVWRFLFCEPDFEVLFMPFVPEVGDVLFGDFAVFEAML